MGSFKKYQSLKINFNHLGINIIQKYSWKCCIGNAFVLFASLLNIVRVIVYNVPAINKRTLDFKIQLANCFTLTSFTIPAQGTVTIRKLAKWIPIRRGALTDLWTSLRYSLEFLRSSLRYLMAVKTGWKRNSAFWFNSRSTFI